MDEIQVNLVSLIIPVYNESEHLERFLRVIDDLTLPVPKELVIVDDFSTDGSGEILKNFSFTSRVQLIRQEKNCGKGAAIRRGIAAATGEVIGIQDADFEYEPSDIPQLLTRLIDGRSDVVFGSRFKNTEQVHRTMHYMINKVLTMLSNVCSGLYLSDMETCYKFFRSDIIKNVKLDSDRFGFEPEVTAKISRLKLRVAEIPISYHPRNYLEGKKITWKDGIAALKHIVHYSFFVSDRDCFTEALPVKYIPKGGNWL